MLVAKYEPGKKGNISHHIPSSVKTITNASLSDSSTIITKSSGVRNEDDKPLCTLFLSFPDSQNKEVTTAHVFPNTKPQLYPQTRRTVYKTSKQVKDGNNSQMSLTSPSLYTDDEIYGRHRLGSTANTKTSSTRSTPTHLYDNQLVQEVSLTYSAPYTSVAKPHEPLAVQIGTNANSIDEYSKVYEENGNNLHSYYSDYSGRYSSAAQKQRNLDSVERLLTSGKIETEFPIKHLESSPEEIPYFSAQSAIQSGKTTPAYTPRATPVVDSRASTVRLPSALSHNTVISESTTIEELTTITTTNRQRNIADMPTVNALTEQFERSASRENKDALKSRKSPNYANNNNSNGNGKNSRVVVINRTNEYSNRHNNNRVRHVEKPTYSPTGIVTTTIVDIEPPGYGRRARIEEYRLEEEYISTKTWPAGYYQQQQQQHQHSQTQTQNSQNQTKEDAVELYVRSQSRSGANSRSNNNYAEDAPSPTVRNVIEQFETRIEERVRPVSVEKENIPRSVSRVEMNKTDDQHFKEKEIIIHRREIEKPRPVEVPPPPPVVKTFEETTTLRMEGSPIRYEESPRVHFTEESARKVEEIEEEPTVIESAPRVRPYQPDFIRTYEEERTTTIRRDGGYGTELRTIVSDPAPDYVVIPKSTVPPPPTPVSPTPQEESRYTTEHTVITTTTAVISNKSDDEIIIPTAEDSEPEAKTPEPIPEDTFRKNVEFEPEEKEEINRQRKEEEELRRRNIEEQKEILQKELEEQRNKQEAESAEIYEKFKREYDRNIRVHTQEEWSTTTRRRDRSLPPPPTSSRSIRNKMSGEYQMSARVETLQSFLPSSRGATDLRSDLYSAYDAIRGRSTSRTADRNIGADIRSISEGRAAYAGYNAYSTTGYQSGLTTGGATICTTHIRDAREREKREIGMLNDRLADYIEKVRFLEAQNRLHSTDIEHLKKGLGGSISIHGLFDVEIKQSKVVIEQIISQRAQFEREVEALTAQINDLRGKLADAISTIKNHRTNFDVDLERLAQLEAEIALTKRKINIVEEDVIRVRKENDNVLRDISRIRGLIHHEMAGKNEQSLRIQDLLHRINSLRSENSQKIDIEMQIIRRDTTSENRDYFRRELQAAMRDIRADYEAKSHQTRVELEQWYREKITKIQHVPRGAESREELMQIRHIVISVKQRLSEVENRNLLLQRQIEDLSQQLSSDHREYQISLEEKDALVQKIREQSQELVIQMEKLCENEITLRAEIERYRTLLNGANVTTYVSHGAPSTRTRVIETTTTSHSQSHSQYAGLSGGHHYQIGSGVGSVADSVTETRKPDRIHDEQGEDENGRQFHSWYKGTIRVKQVTADFIELENICVIRRVDVGGFRIEHRVNGVLQGSVTINHELILNPKQTLRIFSSNHAGLNGEFLINVSHFDDSINSRTSIFNATEPTEERGWFIYLS